MKNWNLRTQLLALVLATALPFLTYVVLLIRQDAVESREAAATNTLNIARQISARIDEQIVTIDNMLGAMGAAVGSDLKAVATNNSQLRAMLADFPEVFADLSVYTPDGIRLNSSTLSTPALDELAIIERNNSRKAVATNTLSISEPVYSSSTSKWLVIFSRPLRDPAGEIRAVISMAILVEHFQNLLLAAGLAPQSLVTLVDAGGSVLARTLEPEAWVNRNISQLPSYVDALRHGEGSAQLLGADGVPRLSGFATGHRTPWMVYVGIPIDVVYAESQTKMLRGTVITVVAVLIAALLAALLSRRIAAPVAALKKSTGELAAGNFSQRLTVSGISEIDALANEFNHLADTLEKEQAAHGEAERRYRDMMDHVDLVTVMLDRSGCITQCNDFLLALTGWTRKEVIGQDWFTVFVPADADDVKNVFLSMLSNNQLPRHFENEILTRSGERRLIHWNNSILRTPSGELIGTASIGEDTTERRRAAQAERALNGRVTALLENMGDGFVAFDHDWRYTHVNTRAGEMFGRSADSLIGKVYLEVYPEAVGTPFEVAYRKVMTDKVAMHIEDYYEVWDRWFENWIYPTQEGISIFFHDITERKRAEQKVAQQVEELQRWYRATLGREDRLQQLKADINVLHERLGEPPRFAATNEDNPAGGTI